MNYKEKVVETLLKETQDNDIDFNWLITLTYHYKETNLNKVISDNNRLRYSIRKFYKSDIKMIFFIERHRESEKISGGFHRHLILQDPPESLWRNRSNQLDRFLLELDPTILFACNFGESPTVTQKKDLLNKVIRGFNQSIPNGKDSVDITPITEDAGGVKGTLDYATKDSWKYGERIENVIDWENSDFVNIEHLSRLRNERQSIQYDFTRHQRVFA